MQKYLTHIPVFFFYLADLSAFEFTDLMLIRTTQNVPPTVQSGEWWRGTKAVKTIIHLSVITTMSRSNLLESRVRTTPTVRRTRSVSTMSAWAVKTTTSPSVSLISILLLVTSSKSLILWTKIPWLKCLRTQLTASGLVTGLISSAMTFSWCSGPRTEARTVTMGSKLALNVPLELTILTSPAVMGQVKTNLDLIHPSHLPNFFVSAAVSVDEYDLQLLVQLRYDCDHCYFSMCRPHQFINTTLARTDLCL